MQEVYKFHNGEGAQHIRLLPDKTTIEQITVAELADTRLTATKQHPVQVIYLNLHHAKTWAQCRQLQTCKKFCSTETG